MNTTPPRNPLDEGITGRAGRLRRWFGVAASPSLRRRTSRRLRPIRRAWLGATLQARAAILARTPLEDYLRARLARYLVKLPVSRAGLALHVDVAGGEIRATPWNTAGPAAAIPARGGTDPWASALAALEGPSVLREVAELEARNAALDLERAAALRRLEDLSRRLEDDLAAGAIAPLPSQEHSAEQLGRPPVRSPAPYLALALLALAVVLAQAWSIAVPLLAASGYYPAALSGKLRPEMVEALLTCVFSLGIAVGLLVLALSGMGAADDLSLAVETAGRRRAQVAALLAGVATAAVAAAAATLPAPRSGQPPLGHAILLLSVSGGAALLLRRASRWRGERAVELAAALAWDRERAGVLGERARRVEEVAWAKALVRDLDRRRERTRHRLDHLARRAARAARLVAVAQERDRMDRHRLTQSLIGALERDRYEFLRQAAARGATDLLTGWKPPAEALPAAGQDPPDPAAGRMAG